MIFITADPPSTGSLNTGWHSLLSSFFDLLCFNVPAYFAGMFSLCLQSTLEYTFSLMTSSYVRMWASFPFLSHWELWKQGL